MPALEAAEADPIRPEWEPYCPLNSSGVNPSIPPKPKRKVAHVLRVLNRHYYRTCLTRIFRHKAAIKTTEKNHLLLNLIRFEEQAIALEDKLHH